MCEPYKIQQRPHSPRSWPQWLHIHRKSKNHLLPLQKHRSCKRARRCIHPLPSYRTCHRHRNLHHCLRIHRRCPVSDMHRWQHRRSCKQSYPNKHPTHRRFHQHRNHSSSCHRNRRKMLGIHTETGHCRWHHHRNYTQLHPSNLCNFQTHKIRR